MAKWVQDAELTCRRCVSVTATSKIPPPAAAPALRDERGRHQPRVLPPAAGCGRCAEPAQNVVERVRLPKEPFVLLCNQLCPWEPCGETARPLGELGHSVQHNDKSSGYSRIGERGTFEAVKGFEDTLEIEVEPLWHGCHAAEQATAR